MERYLTLIIISLVLSITTAALGVEGSSSYFSIESVTFLQGGGSISSANNTALLSTGENIGSTEKFSSTNFGSLAGQLYMLFPQRSLKVTLISNLRGLTEFLGVPIQEAAWQRDDDPYFYWTIQVKPEELVSGFSVSLDSMPDYIIDISSPYYQFPEHSIPSGKHTFYVLPFTSGKGWDTDSLLKFELWVDVDPPVINQLKPSPGEITTNNLIPISCLVYDAHSGLDLALTTLTLNGWPLYFTYDSEKQLLEFKPDTPLSEGKNTVLLKTYDLVGNYLVKGLDFIVDTQPPFGSILINNGEEFTHSAYVSINIDAEDAVSGIKSIYLSNDGIFDTEMQHPYPYAPVISNWLLSEPDVDGIKTVYVKFQDYAGNISETYQDRITLKLLTADTRIISGPPSITSETVAHFKFESSKSGAQFSYKLDELDWSGWSDSKEADFSGLSEGNHHFYVKSGFDLNGDGGITIDEEDATPAQWAWTVKAEGGLEKLRRRILFWRR